MNRNGPITLLLRLEGLALAVVCVWLYAGIHASWWLFAVLLLAPDLSMLGYLAGPRFGAMAYNTVHNWIAPVVLFAIAWWGDAAFLLPVAFALGAHIGFDRALGYGLKLPNSFKETHLGRIGEPGGQGPAAFLLPVAFALGAHIGFDRALGYGLKLPNSFKETHLGRIGEPGGQVRTPSLGAQEPAPRR